MRSAPPAHSVTTRRPVPIVSMPCAITEGRPRSDAARSDQWIGLKSVDAPA